MDLPAPLAIPVERAALARMYIDLTLAFHASAYAPGAAPSEADANLALVGVAVMLGHAEGRPMNASQLASLTNMPRTSILRRLDALIASGLVVRVGSRYAVEPGHATGVPHRDAFELILSKAFAVLGPHLSKMDT